MGTYKELLDQGKEFNTIHTRRRREAFGWGTECC